MDDQGNRWQPFPAARPEGNCLNTALQYASHEWYIYPVRGKEPLISGGFNAASVDPAQIRLWWKKWPDAGVGVATGPSRLAVVDLDRKNNVDGVDTLAALTKQIGPLPRTLQATTPSDGFHLYYKAPAELELKSSAGRVGGVAAPGIDIRASRGGIVTPPTPRYTWLEWTRPVSLPQAWVSALVKRAEPKPRVWARACRPPRSGSRYAAAALRSECDALASAPVGARNDRLFRAAAATARFALTGELQWVDIEQALLAACDANGLLESDGRRAVTKTIESGFCAAERDAK